MNNKLAGDFLMLFAIMIVSAVDIVLTNHLMEVGVTEANPFIGYLMENPGWYEWEEIKLSITLVGAAYLISVKEELLLGKILVIDVIRTIFIVYCITIMYELVLIAQYYQ